MSKKWLFSRLVESPNWINLHGSDVNRHFSRIGKWTLQRNRGLYTAGVVSFDRFHSITVCTIHACSNSAWFHRVCEESAPVEHVDYPQVFAAYPRSKLQIALIQGNFINVKPYNSLRLSLTIRNYQPMHRFHRRLLISTLGMLTYHVLKCPLMWAFGWTAGAHFIRYYNNPWAML